MKSISDQRILLGYLARYKAILPFSFVFASFQNLTSLCPYKSNNWRRRRCVMRSSYKELARGVFVLCHKWRQRWIEEGRLPHPHWGTSCSWKPCLCRDNSRGYSFTQSWGLWSSLVHGRSKLDSLYSDYGCKYQFQEKKNLSPFKNLYFSPTDKGSCGGVPFALISCFTSWGSGS